MVKKFFSVFLIIISVVVLCGVGNPSLEELGDDVIEFVEIDDFDESILNLLS